ncbi:heat shock protein 90-6, mitochondrial-like isoform X1 [Carica papaya]|uniref:heat shock protein 90-6, mitochondrial-like isoform X1 n=1 Tax=Carica papaya TaxID=3649 RepID=UPI000B8CE9AD|nr:heat shock protein 90-6, mitochondrial-like isoform X1 [Carica papaya]
MTRQDLVDCLGTIAQSGAAKFLKAIKESKGAGADSNLIDPEKLIPIGTHLTVYLKKMISSYFQCDDKGLAHPERISKLVKIRSLSPSQYTVSKERDILKRLMRIHLKPKRMVKRRKLRIRRKKNCCQEILGLRTH